MSSATDLARVFVRSGGLLLCSPHCAHAGLYLLKVGILLLGAVPYMVLEPIVGPTWGYCSIRKGECDPCIFDYYLGHVRQLCKTQRLC